MTLNTIAITKDFADIEKVNLLASEAFPPEEYLAPSKLIEMAKDENFDFLALYDGDIFVGFMTVMRYKTLTYLFFLAIDSQNRSKGYGKRAIETIKSLYPNTTQVVDLEMLDDKAKNSAQRESRRKFYIKNGYKPVGEFLSYLGVDYEILCMDEKFDFELFKEMMSSLRVEGFSPRYFKNNIK